MRKKSENFLLISVLVLVTSIALTGCSEKSYPADKIKESLLKICREEYGIQDLDVKVVGQTLGVYLPLKKLFATDFKEAMAEGKVNNIENLFMPSEEALDKVEDVLFSISRVILSTDRDLKFYILQATDVENTGLQLIMKGSVDDIKRVRIWDISRGEYRKRVVHELRLNPSVIWHRPVYGFFADLEILTMSELKDKYFGEAVSKDMIRRLFVQSLYADQENVFGTKWKIVDMRSTEIDKFGIVIYVKTVPQPAISGIFPEDLVLEYLFLLSVGEAEIRINRIIPFQYRNPDGTWKKIAFPEELQLKSNFEEWNEEFPVQEIKMGPFLAKQLTRRVQALAASDERIQNTFSELKLSFDYLEEPEPAHFSLNMDVILKAVPGGDYRRQTIFVHEDMLYFLDLASREFVKVLRSYQFGNYEHLSFIVSQEPTTWVLGRDELELLRRNKMDLQGLHSFANL